MRFRTTRSYHAHQRGRCVRSLAGCSRRSEEWPRGLVRVRRSGGLAGQAGLPAAWSCDIDQMEMQASLAAGDPSVDDGPKLDGHGYGSGGVGAPDHFVAFDIRRPVGSEGGRRDCARSWRTRRGVGCGKACAKVLPACTSAMPAEEQIRQTSFQCAELQLQTSPVEAGHVRLRLPQVTSTVNSVPSVR
jgi:hypothetical protein